jgi:hypothetical protein
MGYLPYAGHAGVSADASNHRACMACARHVLEEKCRGMAKSRVISLLSQTADSAKSHKDNYGKERLT